MTTRSDAYLSRLRKAGGKIVAVRMTAEQLAQLNRLRLPDESASACVNRVIDDRMFHRSLPALLNGVPD